MRVDVLVFTCFQRREVKFLICTDVAARGIDVRGVPYGNLGGPLLLRSPAILHACLKILEAL